MLKIFMRRSSSMGRRRSPHGQKPHLKCLMKPIHCRRYDDLNMRITTQKIRLGSQANIGATESLRPRLPRLLLNTSYPLRFLQTLLRSLAQLIGSLDEVLMVTYQSNNPLQDDLSPMKQHS